MIITIITIVIIIIIIGIIIIILTRLVGSLRFASKSWSNVCLI